ncbi:MAG: YfhO family protein [Candidatus Promineifilaceae bacterium]|nr:YfhO family protein [Candidatus Promineifilaceae bacterium]
MALRNRPYLAAALLFGLIAALFLNKALLPGYTLLPLDLIQTIAPWDGLELGPLSNPLISDPFYSFYTRRHFLTQAVQGGQIPLWNPNIMTGTPTIANPNFQLFYPPNLLAALVLPAKDALPWLAWFHLMLTGLLTFAFLRRHRLHWLAAALGGGAWMLNGYTIVWLENPHRLSTVAWLPGLFWAYEAATQERRPGWAALGGLMLGAAILGGQMQFIFAGGLMLGIYGLVKVIAALWEVRHHSWQPASVARVVWRPIFYLALLGVIGVGIGALALLPANQFAAFSQRMRMTADTIQASRWPMRQIITLIAPDFYGNPINEGGYRGLHNYAEMTAYFGVVTLLLAFTAPFVARQRRFLAHSLAVAAATLALALGTPLARLIFLLPGAPFVVLSRTIFLVPLAGVWLAAAALDGWLRRPEQVTRALLGAVTFIALIVAGTILYLEYNVAERWQPGSSDLVRSAALLATAVVLLLLARKWPRPALAMLVAVALLDLVEWGRNFNPIESTEYLYPYNAVVEELHQDQSLYRVLPLQSEKVVFGPNILSIYGLQTMGGYTPLIKEKYYRLFKSMDDDVIVEWMRPNRNMLVMSHFDPLVSLFNVKYVLAANEVPHTIVPQAGNDDCSQTLPLSDTLHTEAFTATSPGLNRLDVHVASVDETTGAGMEIWLWRDEVGGEPVAEKVLTGEELVAGGYHPIFFAPVADAAGQQFVWGVKGTERITLCASEDGTAGYAAYGTWLLPHGQAQGVWIYENANVLPRSFLVHHVTIAEDDEVVDAIHDASFNWYHSAVLNRELPAEQQAQLAAAPRRSDSRVTVVDYGLHEVTVDVETSAAGLLVLSDAYYPGWQATVDGETATIHPTNGTLRGIFVPAGAHRVQFQFRPAVLRTGLILAGTSVLVALLFIGRELPVTMNENNREKRALTHNPNDS